MEMIVRIPNLVKYSAFAQNTIPDLIAFAVFTVIHALPKEENNLFSLIFINYSSFHRFSF